MSLHAQVQFHANYPVFDNQSDREVTFNYAIHIYIYIDIIFPQLIKHIS